MKNLNAYWLLLLSLSGNTLAAEPAAPIANSIELGEWGVQIEFDKPMQTWHSKTRIEHIRITPEVQCDWYWDDDTVLTCRVPRNLGVIKPFSFYRVELLGGLVSQEGVEIKPSVKTVTSSSPEISAHIDSWVDGKPRFQLMAGPGVDAAAIQQVLSLTLGEKRIPYRLKSKANSSEDRLSYELEYSPGDIDEGLLGLKIVPGLRTTLGPVPGEQDKEMLLARIEPFQLREITCSRSNVYIPINEPFDKPGAVLCDPQRAITLDFSEALDTNSLALLEKNLPSGFTLKAEKMSSYGGSRWGDAQTAPDAVYTIVADTANAHYDLPLSISTRSASGRTLKKLPALSLASGNFLSGARLSPRRKLLLPGERDETVLTTINLEEKRLKFEGLSIGSDIEQKRQTIRLKSPPNRSERSTLIGASAALKKEGGLYQLVSTTESYKNLAYQRLFAPFNALVSRKNDQVLVWATEWQTGASIPGAKVEVLLLDEQKQLHVLASGISDADGVAVLIAELKAGMNPKWQSQVRVSKQDRTLVQTIGDTFDGKLNFKMRSWSNNVWKSPSKMERAVFGVTELPLYRPGETVKYRVWLRERFGNRLKLPTLGKSLKTELHDSDNNQSLESWDAVYDVNGSHSGEVRLSNLLTDGTYCIRAADFNNSNYRDDYSGACFEIARFEAQPLWAELKSDQNMLLLGQKMNLTVESGFFSGGPAADIALGYSGLASSQRFEEAYPEFAEYTFAGSGRWNEKAGDNPFRNRKTPVKTDAKGKARFVYAYDSPMQNEGDESDIIAFGKLEMNVEVRIPGKAASASNTVTTRFSQFERYVGLKSREWWLSLDAEPGLEAVVVDFRGKAIFDVPVIISVFHIEGKSETAVGECTILSGRKTACGYKPNKSGRYLFKANSHNAAAAELSRYAGSRATTDDDEQPVVELQLIKASNGVLPAEVRLIQPYAVANVLFTMEYEHVVHHWVQRIVGNDTLLSIPVKAMWAPGVTLRVVVRPADLANAREAAEIDTLDAVLKLEISRARVDDFKVTTDRSLYKPGELVKITLRNDSSQTRHATLSVLDDSVYQQGMHIWPYQSPDEKNFLGKLDDWTNPDWYGLDSWPRYTQSETGDEAVEIDVVTVVGSKIRRIVEEEGAQPVQVLKRADIERGGLNSVYEILNTITSSDGSGLSTVTTGEAKEIDMVSVVGSRISAADAFQRTQAINRELKRQDNRNGKRLPHVRSQFRDAVYWNPDVVLAPGESKTVGVKLPDNLTRWRVLVWTSDDGDGFAQHQASFETSLPIEVRTGLPGQLFVGDQASAQITARNQQKKQVTMTLTSAVSGAGVGLSKASEDKVSAFASLSQGLVFSPRTEGPLDLLSIADTTKASDGVSTSVNVQSRMGTEVLPQSGWLDEAMLRLTIPALNVSAIRPELELTVHHGFHDWTEGWLKDLQEYPHRCWEQTLSRAIGAAYSKQYDASSTWTDRSVVISDALQAAPSFQEENGYFRYFRTEQNHSNDTPDYVLSAYTIKGFDYLKSLSVVTPDELRAELEDKLAKVFSTATVLDVNGRPKIPYETSANIAGVLVDEKSLDENTLNVLWNQWGELSWYARSELLLALSRKPEFSVQLQEGIARLQQAGKQHGLRRVLNDNRDFSAYMGSGLRDQCAVAATLWQLDKSEAGLPMRKAMLRGVYDLYAGGTASLDTQSSAQCLMSLHSVTSAMPQRENDLVVKAELGKTAHELTLPAKQSHAGFKQALDSSTKTLKIAGSDALDGALHYNAVIRYQYDLRDAEAKGTGIALHRHYDVLRNGNWIPIGKSAVSEGDWVRVRLLVTVPKERHFVAVTDVVPGGLVSRDIGLSSVGGAQLQKIGGDGSYYFNTRQTKADTVQIYAEYLPAGQHEIYYYAQAVHPGDYFAPPAIAELMYGRASRANTTSERVVVRPGK